MIRKWIFIVLACFTSLVLWSQPTNDQCNTPIKLGDVTKYCSKVGEYSLQGASPSGYGPSTCWTSMSGDVWFTFRAFASDVSITIIGTNSTNPGGAGGTLKGMQASLYSGICGGTISELNCANDVNLVGTTTMYEGGLIVGQDYYIRVDAVQGQTGTFQLCINNYFPPAQPEQDCNNATLLCNSEPFVVKAILGAGLVRDEGRGSCLGEGGGISASEQQSIWFSWIAAARCTLTFTITPLNQGDDIDFALYELPSGLRNCNDKVLARCNASAPPCSPTRRVPYSTGLSLTDNDISENFNCDAGENAFSKYLILEQGKAYGLLINNFTASGQGFSIEFDGCDFQGPEAAFTIDPLIGLRCETDFTITDSSSFAIGRIVSYEWNFGKDAVPQTASTKGPHKVRYNSFGEKFITLTLLTDLGCKVTEVRRLYAEPCCEDLPTLRLNVDSLLNLKCYNSNDGKIVVSGRQGNPYYDQTTGSNYFLYSLDGFNYLPISAFANLPAGSYKLYIQDRKGCVDSTTVTISEPPPISPNAGSNLEIDLGEYVTLSGSATPDDIYQYMWLGDSVQCMTCQTTQVRPINSGYYKLKVTNQNDCIGYDSVYIQVNKYYDVFAPNVFSPNGDNVNDFFNIFGSSAVLHVESLKIFDRWGDLVYDGKFVPINNPLVGWDGRFRDKPMNPAVFTYVAKVKFIDGVIKDLAGEFTLVK